MKKPLFFLCVLSISISFAQEIRGKIPAFPDYFNQHKDSISHYLKAYNSNSVLKSLKKETVYSGEKLLSEELSFNKLGIKINKDGLPVTKRKDSSVENTSIKIYTPINKNEEDYRVTDGEGYMLSEEYKYNSDQLLEFYVKYLENSSYDVITYVYNKHQQLVEKTTKCFHGVSEDSYGRVYLKDEPTTTIIETGVYKKGRLVKLFKEEMVNEFQYHYIEQTEQQIEYGKKNLPKFVYKNVVLEDKDAKKVTKFTYKLKLDYTPEHHLHTATVYDKDETVKEKVLYTYNNNRLKKLTVTPSKNNSVGEFHIVYNKNNSVATINLKLNENESEIYTYNYH